MPSSIDTLGAMIDKGYALHVYCDTWACNGSKLVDLDALAARYGRDYGCMHADLIRLRWRCQKCGGRKVTFRFQPDGAENVARGGPDHGGDLPWENEKTRQP